MKRDRLTEMVDEVYQNGPSLLQIERVAYDPAQRILTDSEHVTLAYIYNYNLLKQRMPAVRRIQKDLEISSTSMVNFYVNGLIKKGFIAKDIEETATNAKKEEGKNKHRAEAGNMTILKVFDTPDFPTLDIS